MIFLGNGLTLKGVFQTTCKEQLALVGGLLQKGVC